MRRIAIARRGAYWRFDFEADAFLHHMIRNIMGCLVRDRPGPAAAAMDAPRCWRRATAIVAAPTFSPDGLYFLGPVYERRLEPSQPHGCV